MAKLPESVTKGDKSNSWHSLKERLTNPFCNQWEMFFGIFLPDPHPPAEKGSSLKLSNLKNRVNNSCIYL